MNKEDIIKKIKEDTGCDEHEAEIFLKEHWMTASSRGT